MLAFFSDPYPEEILYHVIARYHYNSGNPNYKDTLTEIFGSSTVIPSVELPCKLDYLAGQLKNTHYSSDYFLYQHTTFPLYVPFLPKDRRDKLKKTICYEKGNGIYTSIGLVAGSLCKKNSLYYCPICVEKDLDLLGEGYFHRVHQVQGVFVCPHHACWLEPYPISPCMTSRLHFIRLDYHDITMQPTYNVSKKLNLGLLKIAQTVQFLLENNCQHLDINILHGKYMNLLNQMGLLTSCSFITQEELHNRLIGFHGEDLLRQLDSFPDVSFESNWLKIAVRKPRRVVHPIRQILLILFLSNYNYQTFFMKDSRASGPFGDPPWPCLNPIASHYLTPIIESIQISRDTKTKQPVGTFSCDCGFVYSRRGPDKEENDRYKIGRIKIFGTEWEDKLKKLILKRKYGLRELARHMACDPKTVVKYADKLGLEDCINSTMKFAKEDGSINEEQTLRKLYEQDVLNLISIHPEYTRQQLRNELKKQYAWFYRNDKEWLDANFPPITPRGERNKQPNNRVDWEKRDQEMVQAVKDAYEEIITRSKPVRVTQSLIAHMIGKTALLERHMDRLPQTYKYILAIVETIEEFRIRRIKTVCRELVRNNDNLRKWIVVRKAGLRPGYTPIVDSAIEESINYYERYN